MILFEENGERQSRRGPRVRKVHYGYYDREFGLPHPVIRIEGKYLEVYGFAIGDLFEVQLDVGQITLTKVPQTVPA